MSKGKLAKIGYQKMKWGIVTGEAMDVYVKNSETSFQNIDQVIAVLDNDILVLHSAKAGMTNIV
jgi:hypothetical protein